MLAQRCPHQWSAVSAPEDWSSKVHQPESRETPALSPARATSGGRSSHFERFVHELGLATCCCSWACGSGKSTICSAYRSMRNTRDPVFSNWRNGNVHNQLRNTFLWNHVSCPNKLFQVRALHTRVVPVSACRNSRHGVSNKKPSCQRKTRHCWSVRNFINHGCWRHRCWYRSVFNSC